MSVTERRPYATWSARSSPPTFRTTRGCCSARPPRHAPASSNSRSPAPAPSTSPTPPERPSPPSGWTSRPPCWPTTPSPRTGCRPCWHAYTASSCTAGRSPRGAVDPDARLLRFTVAPHSALRFDVAEVEAALAAAGGAAVLLEHAAEYELVEDGEELALALLRPTGQISRNRRIHRDEPAGPQIPAPGAQCRGLRTVTFALLPYTGEWHEAGVHAAAESFRHPLVALPGTAAAGTVLPGSAEGLRVEGTGVVLSSPRERDGRLEVRLCAQTPHAGPAALALPGLRAARRCDLLGNPG
ncbi:MAG: hypothetical protein ACRDOV_06800, partial [Streptomyces sp.]